MRIVNIPYSASVLCPLHQTEDNVIMLIMKVPKSILCGLIKINTVAIKFDSIYDCNLCHLAVSEQQKLEISSLDAVRVIQNSWIKPVIFTNDNNK